MFLMTNYLYVLSLCTLISVIVSAHCVVHTYGTLLESELTYTPLRPDQMPNGCLDVSVDEDTSSMDEIPQRIISKPQRKTKGTVVVLPGCRGQP